MSIKSLSLILRRTNFRRPFSSIRRNWLSDKSSSSIFVRWKRLISFNRFLNNCSFRSLDRFVRLIDSNLLFESRTVDRSLRLLRFIYLNWLSKSFSYRRLGTLVRTIVYNLFLEMSAAVRLLRLLRLIYFSWFKWRFSYLSLKRPVRSIDFNLLPAKLRELRRERPETSILAKTLLKATFKSTSEKGSWFLLIAEISLNSRVIVFRFLNQEKHSDSWVTPILLP